MITYKNIGKMIKVGTRFLRADLHIHSYGEFGSYDVSDSTMTPEAIVDKAIEKGLDIISITDHNEIQNSHTAIEYSKGKSIFVVPGIEVSTTQGHLLVYFPTFSDLRNFHGKLNINAGKDQCTQGIVECLNLSEQHNGFGVLAHIELDSGFEKTIGRFGPQMKNVFTHKNLLGLEISQKSSINFYSDDDVDTNRKTLVTQRRSVLNQSEGIILPKVMSSDSHTLERLGKNADGEDKLTRIKLDEISFEAFRIAFLLYDSRIRIENFVPESRSVIDNISIKGELLDGMNCELSSNLTCIIGGRGAGKSTLLECIKSSSGNYGTSDVIDSEVWPQEIQLKYRDETGQEIVFRREKNNDTQNITDPSEGITKVDIETYGQGETAEILKHGKENPRLLIKFFDRLLSLQGLVSEDRQIIQELLDNQSTAKQLRLELSKYEDTKKLLKNEKQKLENLKKQDAGELVKFQSSLIKERKIRGEIIDDLNSLVKKYREILGNDETFQEFQGLEDDDIVLGKTYFQKVKKIVEDFSSIVADKSKELNDALNQKIDDLKIQIEEWSQKEKEEQNKIDAKKEELEKLGIPFDLGKINQIAKDVIGFENKLKKLEGDAKELEKLIKNRKELLERRASIKNQIFLRRNVFGTKVNTMVSNKKEGIFIKLQYHQGRFSINFEEQLKSLMDWRTRQVPRAERILRYYSVAEFIEICKKKDIESMRKVLDDDRRPIFSDSDIQSIFSRVIENYNYEDFEALDYDDIPIISVTKLVDDGSGKKKPVKKSIFDLSLGQQHSILLSMLLLSDSNKPLIIDQPEDHLDSEFVYKTIVFNLRRIKEYRQVIIVTHNANIAVLSDAELILPLKSTSIKTSILGAGSIDKSETRKMCCEILEGGKNAFKQREDIYSIS